MKVASAWSGHDCSFCILDNGRPVVHAEYERYIREWALGLFSSGYLDFNKKDRKISLNP